MSASVTEPAYDILVIGGGIAGAGLVRDAALRGLSTVLLEKNRFGSGTSSKSSKLIHGGIRYLETAWIALKRGKAGEAFKNFRFVRHALRECRTLERIAPDLARPIPILIPVYRRDKRSMTAVFAGSLFYFLLALGYGGARFPKMFWSARSVLAQLPSLDPNGLVGGVMIWDRLTDDRALVRRNIESAMRAGAACLENTAVTAYRKTTDGLFEVTARHNGAQKIWMCRRLVNATGPWIDRTRALGADTQGQLITPLAGSHIQIQKFLPISALLQAEDQRFFFVINIGDFARVGTTETLGGDPDKSETTEAEKDYLLRSISRYFPNKKFGREAVLSADTGIRPLAHSPVAEDPAGISREHRLSLSPDGVMHLAGVKLTDYRRAAEEALDKLFPGTRSSTAKERI